MTLTPDPKPDRNLDPTSDQTPVPTPDPTPEQTEAKPDLHPARRRRWRGLLVNLLIVVAIFVGVHWYKARPLASGAAPPLEAPLTAIAPPAQDRASGTDDARIGTEPMFDLADWHGQPVLVHFWATWCPVCKLGEAGIDALREDFNVVTIALQSGNAAEINAYLREHDLGFAAIADPYGEIASAWGVQGVPTTFVIGEDGRIAFAGVGYTAGLGLRARLWAAGGRE